MLYGEPMSGTNWCIAVYGHTADLEELRARVATAEFVIEQRGSEYRLSSSRFSGLLDEHEVGAVAQSLVALLNFAGLLRVDGFKPIAPGRVIEIRADGTEKHYITVSDTIHLRASAKVMVVNADGTVSEPKLESLVPVLKVLEKSPRLQSAAHYLIHEPNWYGHYKVYEAVSDHVGGAKKIVEKGWCAKSELTRFTDSAQPTRHHRHQPPSDPMLESDGQKLVLQLVQSAIHEALQKAKP